MGELRTSSMLFSKLSMMDSVAFRIDRLGTENPLVRLAVPRYRSIRCFASPRVW